MGKQENTVSLHLCGLRPECAIGFMFLLILFFPFSAHVSACRDSAGSYLPKWKIYYFLMNAKKIGIFYSNFAANKLNDFGKVT